MGASLFPSSDVISNRKTDLGTSHGADSGFGSATCARACGVPMRWDHVSVRMTAATSLEGQQPRHKPPVAPCSEPRPSSTRQPGDHSPLSMCHFENIPEVESHNAGPLGVGASPQRHCLVIRGPAGPLQGTGFAASVWLRRMKLPGTSSCEWLLHEPGFSFLSHKFSGASLLGRMTFTHPVL